MFCHVCGYWLYARRDDTGRFYYRCDGCKVSYYPDLVNTANNKRKEYDL